MKAITVLITIVIALMTSAVLAALPLARLTVKAIDENGAPVLGAKVTLTFRNPITMEGVVVTGNTDLRGFFSGEGGSDGAIGASVVKDGYYPGGFPFQPFRDAKNGRWLPWDSTYTSVLRKIENPVPMYARRMWVTVPETDKACGYDLMEADWVEPWGKGKVSDFVFTMKKSFTNSENLELVMELSFSVPQDGILKTELPKEYAPSLFKWLRQAPDAGYQPSWQQKFRMPLTKEYRIQDTEKQKFFYRVRTVEKDGKIVSGLYGKLEEGFQIGLSHTNKCAVRLNYYLNPTPNDRNMEYDPKQNLFLKAPKEAYEKLQQEQWKKGPHPYDENEDKARRQAYKTWNDLKSSCENLPP